MVLVAGSNFFGFLDESRRRMREIIFFFFFLWPLSKHCVHSVLPSCWQREREERWQRSSAKARGSRSPLTARTEKGNQCVDVDIACRR